MTCTTLGGANRRSRCSTGTPRDRRCPEPALAARVRSLPPKLLAMHRRDVRPRAAESRAPTNTGAPPVAGYAHTCSVSMPVPPRRPDPPPTRQHERLLRLPAAIVGVSITTCGPTVPLPFGCEDDAHFLPRHRRAPSPIARTPGCSVPTNPTPGAHVNTPVARRACDPTGSGANPSPPRRYPCSARRARPAAARTRSISSPRITYARRCRAVRTPRRVEIPAAPAERSAPRRAARRHRTASARADAAAVVAAPSAAVSRACAVRDREVAAADPFGRALVVGRPSTRSCAGRSSAPSCRASGSRPRPFVLLSPGNSAAMSGRKWL